MKRLDCTEAERLIVANLDEGPGETTRNALDAHLEQCAGCLKAREEYAALLESFVADAAPEPGEEYWTRYQTSLHARLREHDLDRRWRFGWKHLGVALAGCAVVLAVLVVRLPPTAPYDGSRDTVASAAVLEELYRCYGPSLEEVGNGRYAWEPTLTSYDGTYGWEELTLDLVPDEPAPGQYWL